MRFDGLKVSGLGPFRGPVELDLAGIDGKLLAVCGANGSGKTTLLELLAGGLHRETPTRGSLASLATARDASLEVRFTNGQPWTLRHSIDSLSGAGDSLVLDRDGRPVTDSAKRRSFDAWAAKHLPSKEVLFSSVFTPQGAGGFLDLKPGDRKAVVLRVLGIEKLEALAEAARGHARDARTEVAKLTAQMETLGELDLDASRAQLAEAEQAAAEAEQALLAARERAERARAYAAVAARIAPTMAKLRDLEERRANNRRILEEADIIRGAGKGVEMVRPACEAIERDLGAARDRLSWLRVREAELASEVAGLTRSVPGLESRLRAARLTLESRDQVARAKMRSAELREVLAHGEATLAEEREQAEALRGELDAKAAGRIGALRGHLDGIAASVRADSKARARAALKEDDDTAAIITTAPAQLQELRDREAAGERALRELRQVLSRVEAEAARADAIADAEQAVVDLEAELANVEAVKTAKAEELSHVVHEAAGVAADVDRIAGDLESSRAELDRLDRIARRLPHIEGAAARIAEYEPQIAELRAELAQMEAVDVEHPCPGVVEAAETALAATRARRERAALALERAEQAVVQRDGYAAQLATAQAELADWVRLADDLGRDGLQATLIQCAAPELTELANDFLHKAFGTRWTVTIDASRSSSDGKRELAGMEVQVLDVVAGREAGAETFSGGEKVIIQEAVSLALTTMACRQAGITGCTLIRDESSAALDPAKSVAYVQMLRRAAELVSADKVLVVSHSREVQDLCDARITITDGRIEVAS